jgi:hypothetical protein
LSNILLSRLIPYAEEVIGYHQCGFRRCGDPDVDERIILRWIFRKWEGLWGLDGAGSGKGHVVGTCEYGNGLSGSINAGNFLTNCKNHLVSEEGLCSME